MEIKNFIELFAGQFDDTDENLLTPDCEFQELEEWGSLVALGVIALAKTEYGKKITGQEIRSCKTIEDLFHLIQSK